MQRRCVWPYDTRRATIIIFCATPTGLRLCWRCSSLCKSFPFVSSSLYTSRCSMHHSQLPVPNAALASRPVASATAAAMSTQAGTGRTGAGRTVGAVIAHGSLGGAGGMSAPAPVIGGGAQAGAATSGSGACMRPHALTVLSPGRQAASELQTAAASQLGTGTKAGIRKHKQGGSTVQAGACRKQARTLAEANASTPGARKRPSSPSMHVSTMVEMRVQGMATL